tara:strand:- start:926 stop:2260 length:1335 start_codon:yes stop_codon:yes gene_type:complete
MNNNNKNTKIPLLQISRQIDKTYNNPLNNLNKNFDTNTYFEMRIKALLDKIQNERNRINQNILQIEDKKDVLDGKDSLDHYIKGINSKYDSLYPGFKSASTNIVNPFLIKSDPIRFNNIKPKIEFVKIDVNISNIQDILDLIEKYPLKWDVQYNINMQAMHNIKKPLVRLDKMIGMKNLKENIIDQILYFVQNLHKNNNQENIDFMHTVIYGPPGTGKTEIANIIGDIFSNLGILKNRVFKKVTRTELIAGYLGQTAIKTKDVVKSCLGGCLFIDEAYALGNSEKRDSFAKECIDTLCEALSFYKNNLMVIIAGYEKDLKDCFFAYNSGLESRFTWRFNTDDYNANELNQIFQKKVDDIGWSFKEPVKDSWFKNNMDYFKYYGRDMETLLAKTKICHSRRVFGKEDSEKRQINMEDMKKGFQKFLDNDEVKNRKEKGVLPHMYI